MSSGSWIHEIATTVSADRLFKATVIDWHNLGPKIASEVIASAAVLSGDGAAGSIRELKFTSVLPFSFIKERLDFVDHEKFETKSTLIEGGDLGKTLESASTHFKFEPTEGGCVVKVVATYKILPGVAADEGQIVKGKEAVTNHIKVPGVAADEGQIVKGKEAVTNHIKVAEAYLLANPTAYAQGLFGKGILTIKQPENLLFIVL